MEHDYAPDGAHRHHDLEKVQVEILKQHKYLESQLNGLRDSIRHMCSGVTSGGCGADYVGAPRLGDRHYASDRVRHRALDSPHLAPHMGQHLHHPQRHPSKFVTDHQVHVFNTRTGRRL